MENSLYLEFIFTQINLLLMRINSLVCMAIFLLASCSKNDNPTTISGKIKTTSNNSNVSAPGYSITNHNYDNNGRLLNTTTTNNAGQIVSKTQATYSSNNILIESFNATTRLGYQEYILNSIGLVDTLKISYAPFDTIIDCSKVIYNSANVPLTLKKLAPYPITGQPVNVEKSRIEYTYSGGNIITQKVFNSNQLESVHNIEYYDTANNLSPDAFGLPYMLNNNANLIKKESAFNISTSDSSIVEYTYTFDSNNRVISQTQTVTLGGSGSYTTYYTYY